MSITEINSVVAGKNTETAHYDDVFNGVVALKQAGNERTLGGQLDQEMTDTAFAPIPGHAILEIDATNLGGFTIEVHAMAFVVGGTGQIRLWDITAAAAVGSAVNVTNTTPALVKITGLAGLLAAALHTYRLEGKGAASTDRLTVYAARLLLK